MEYAFERKIIQTIKDLPDSFTIDELIDKIIRLQKIEIGLEQSVNRQTLSTPEAKERLKKWLK